MAADKASNIYSTAYQTWKDAHSQFNSAVEGYLDACLSFEEVCTGPLASNAALPMLEEVITALDSELPGLNSGVERASVANKIVKALRNRSATLTPITVLPSEVLIRVFELVCHSRENRSLAYNPSQSPRSLACVNTYWRRLILGDSHLWTRINLASFNKRSNKLHEHTRTQLKYARESFIYVNLDSTQQWSDYSLFDETRDLLIEVAPRLRSLTYRGEESTGYSPVEVLSCWIQHGTSGTGHALRLLSYSSLQFPRDLALELSERHLHFIRWSSSLYHNLVELDLSFDRDFTQFPTAAEFAAVLSASPALRALKIFGFGLQSLLESDTVGPILPSAMQSTTTSSNIYSEALRTWKNAHKRFNAAIEEYYDACLSFEATCSGPLARDAIQPMLEEVLAALESELPELLLEIEKVSNANKVLKTLRNRSAALTPISILPSELLTRIFEFFCLSRDNSALAYNPSESPRALAGVCTYWRRLTLESSYLWTCINLASLTKLGNKPHKYTQTQLKYARRLSLDISFDGTQQWSDYSDFLETKALFIEAASRLCSLTYQAERLTGYSPIEFLSYWVKHGTPGSCRALKFVASSSHLFPGEYRSDLFLSRSIPMEQIESFLAPIQYLTLHHLFIGWSSSLYHNLVELDLSFNSSFADFPTIAQFSAVLSNSPGLRALKFNGFRLMSITSSPYATEPIPLNNLEILFLKNIHRRSLRFLLPMIQPGSKPLYMRFDLPKRRADFSYYLKLLRRSRVFKLMIAGRGGYPLHSLMASLEGVQHLLLTEFVIDISFWQLMHDTVIPYAQAQLPSVWPSLRTLHLLECKFEGSEYDYYLEETPIPFNFMVWIWGLDEFHEMDRSWIDPDSPELQRILSTLSRYVPGLQQVQPDGSIIFEAWRSALNFAPYFQCAP
ncbi:hypothetical protein FRC07_001865 [Ceratobasidium sp. 392]|nr:hypothetical protein FRC07_001865 [Ceratobasidium sp. 392]